MPRQTQAGIGLSAQGRTRAKQAQASAPRQNQTRSEGGATTHGRRTRQAKACQHRRGRGLAGAHRRRHTKQERCDKIQTPQLHVPRGHPQCTDVSGCGSLLRVVFVETFVVWMSKGRSSSGAFRGNVGPVFLCPWKFSRLRKNAILGT